MDVANWYLYFTVVFRGLGILVFLEVLRLQWKETRVKDGLEFMRWGIFIGEFVYVGLAAVGMSTFFTNPVEIRDILSVVRENSYFNFLSLVNGLGFFLISLILLLIYKVKYPKYKGGEHIHE